jgi:non-specific serine/threonine protein kinase/serine/threonine-protein kinase
MTDVSQTAGPSAALTFTGSTVALPAGASRVEGEPLPQGTLVGPYRIEKLLGRGGMGEVYLAEQLSPVHRMVALKLLAGRALDSAQAALFAIEIELLARMRHPAIAQVFDAGTTVDGHPYFAMEYVEGEPLLRYCDGRGLDLRQRLELFVRICQGVQHAHQKGVIHRDLKPGNILVADVDGVPMPKIIDFGVALTERAAREDGAPTAGTPEYMSPEQAGIVPLDVDVRSDVFALGIILCELLTSTRPLGRDWYRSGRSIDALHVTRPSEQLSASEVDLSGVARQRRLEPARLVRLLRRELDWVVLKATRPQRDERYASAALLAEDLRAFLESRPVAAVPATRGYRMRTFMGRHRLVLAAALAVLGALVAGLTLAVAGFIEARAERDRATAALALAEAVNDFLVEDLLGSADIEVQADGGEISVREVLSRASGAAARRFADEPLVEAGVRLTLGTSLRGLGDRAAAEGELRRALELRRDRLGEDDPATLQAAHRLATVIHQLGRFEEAEALYRDTWSRQRHIFGEDDPATIASRNSLGVLAWQIGQVDEGIAHAEAALAAARRTLGGEQRETLIAMNNLGRLYRARERFGEAEALHLAAIAGRTRLYGEDSVLTLEARNDLAGLYRGTGRLEEAAAMFEGVVESHLRVAGPRHTGTLVAQNNLARTLGNLGRHPEAVALYREVLTHAPHALPEGHWLLAMFSMNLAESLTALGEFVEARERLVAAEARLRQTFGAEDPRTRAAAARLAALEEAASGAVP